MAYFGSCCDLPLRNNGYAITTSLAMSHGQTNIAKRAEGYGLPGVAVDGQDVELSMLPRLRRSFEREPVRTNLD